MIDIDIPVPDGLAYLPYQKGGIAFGASRPNCLIADDMGLGKTVQSIGICNLDPTIERVLIVCPASLKINWLREFTKWDVKGLSVAIADADMYPMANVVILNFDILKKHTRYIHSTIYDVLIVDEAHFLKNPKAKRTTAVFGNDKGELIQAKRKIFLTGTPITNRPIEAWTLCHNLAPDIFPDWYKFATRYCSGTRTAFGFDSSGASNLDELQTKLRGSIMVRRLKSEVLKELPKKRRQVIELGSEGNKVILKKEKEAFQKWQSTVVDRQVDALLAMTEDEQAYRLAVGRFKFESDAAFDEMSKVRKEVAMAKIPFATTVIFLELDWRPGFVSQAEDRCHRIGQRNSVLVQHLLLEGSTDVNMARVIIQKQEIIEKALDNPTAAEEVILEEKKEAIAKAGIELSELASYLSAYNTPGIDRPAKSLLEEISPEDLEREYEKFNIPAELAKAVHKGLNILSSHCDGARERDKSGFNKIDVAVGKNLAARSFLSTKQVVLGKKILFKYHRQLPEEINTIIRTLQEPKMEQPSTVG